MCGFASKLAVRHFAVDYFAMGHFAVMTLPYESYGTLCREVHFDIKTLCNGLHFAISEVRDTLP